MQRRIVGIDLGITSAHAAAVLDETGQLVGRRRCRPTVESLEALERSALASAGTGVVLEVVIEPTGVAWLPVAVFFASRGHTVFRISSAKAADMRRYLSRHAKSNKIDALALAKVAIVDPEHLLALELTDSRERTALDRRMRAADYLTDQAAEHKTRIQDLARHAMPTVDRVFTNRMGKADLAVLERYGDPRKLIELGVELLTGFIRAESNGWHGEVRAQAWLEAATQAVALYGDHPAVGYEALAAEMASEARIIRALSAERDGHAEAREQAYVAVDPEEVARSLPGISAVGAPILVATMGRPGRFRHGGAFKAYTGLTPRSSGTGDAETKGQAISHAGSGRLRAQLVMSANWARRLDPQLAAVYYEQMTERGAHHTKALCVVAARLAERAWATMRRGQPYVIRDIDGRPVTAEEARAIIARHYTVSPEVRRRRSARQRKAAGRVPHQVLEAHR